MQRSKLRPSFQPAFAMLRHRNGVRVAIVGATGAVGTELLSILMERKFPLGDLHLVASPRGAGRMISAFGREHSVHDLQAFHFEDMDLAVFLAGAPVFRFAVRVPVLNGHSEALVLRFHEQVDLNLACEALCKAPMIRFYPGNEYPNIHDVSGSHYVHVAESTRTRRIPTYLRLGCCRQSPCGSRTQCRGNRGMYV